MRGIWIVLFVSACGSSGGGTDGSGGSGGIDAPMIDASGGAGGAGGMADGGPLQCPGRDGGTVTLRPVDLLFMVDDSSSMTAVQQNLTVNFPVLINTLTQTLGQLPDLHIGITTSSMGAGAYTSSVPGCMSPDLGNFVTTTRANTSSICATARLNSGEHFIRVSQSGATTNFSGTLTDVFSCLAQVGANGCGFEHQLAAVRAALGDPTMNLPAPAGNAGFMRDGALLVVVLITNEDDCSGPPDSELYDPSQNSVTDPLGPLASFRCTEFGILCSGQRPPRFAAGPLLNCVSNDQAFNTDPRHALIPAQFFSDYLARVKNNPCDLLVAAIVAPAEPFSVVIDQQTGFPALAHSCSASNGTFGDPAVRIKQVTDSLGNRAVLDSICNTSYASAMTQIANLIANAP